MDELTASIQHFDGPDLVNAAMAHLNLAMIHPFVDGNGRMARCLQTLVLARSSSIRVSPVFCSIEEWLGRNTEEYYAVLGATGEGHWHPEWDTRRWLRFCLNAHHQQAQTLAWRVHAFEELWDRCHELVERSSVPIRATGPLCDGAQGLRIRNASYRSAVKESDGDEISVHAAGSDLRALVTAGLLEARGETRGRSYVGTKVLRDVYSKIRESQPKPAMMDLFAPPPKQLDLNLCT